MSFFTGIKNAFSGGGIDESVWNIPESENDLEQIFDRSTEKPQLIYKHSNSCSICWFAKSEIEAASESIMELADLHFINVVRFRAISNLIASKSGIIHQSPQVLIIQNGKVFWHASHGRIRAHAILEQLRG
ncbi:MAG TPA: bacillithiol system redox-active protein YtxJ [Bacteroidales bacterium]|nr:bacillithiol system redox-active protein YtxJ [Bacteroidales bacterium]HMB97126.1 bacillithiol system redox-active protein YtxJ [Balneolaceae bacterium]